MSEVRRYLIDARPLGIIHEPTDEEGYCELVSGNGHDQLCADHAAALAERDEKIRQLERALSIESARATELYAEVERLREFEVTAQTADEELQEESSRLDAETALRARLAKLEEASRNLIADTEEGDEDGDYPGSYDEASMNALKAALKVGHE